MRTHQSLILTIIIAGVLYSCGGSSELEEKKAQLEEYKKQLAELNANINKLESEIKAKDSTFNVSSKVLVSTYEVKKSPFEHRIEVRGTVASKKNVLISAEMMGRVEAINVTEGDAVKAGELLLKLDADIVQNNIAEVKTQLDLAETVYQRQKNLWEQNIGTEIQYLQAKNNKESLERRLATLESQLAQAYVRAPFAGEVDEVAVKLGEMAQPGLPLVRIVNPYEMYIQADVSEAYLGKLKAGDQVDVYFPVQDANFKSKITAVSRVLNMQNRTFSIEVTLPKNEAYEFRPNQVAILTLTDYRNENAITVPTKIIQTDDQGKFVYVIDKESGTKVAKKVRVKPGKTFQSETEILSGLSGNETVIDRGYRDVNEGVEIAVSTASL